MSKFEHTRHCLVRLLHGDGECECGASQRIERLRKEADEAHNAEHAASVRAYEIEQKLASCKAYRSAVERVLEREATIAIGDSGEWEVRLWRGDCMVPI